MGKACQRPHGTGHITSCHFRNLTSKFPTRDVYYSRSTWLAVGSLLVKDRMARNTPQRKRPEGAKEYRQGRKSLRESRQRTERRRCDRSNHSDALSGCAPCCMLGRPTALKLYLKLNERRFNKILNTNFKLNFERSDPFRTSSRERHVGFLLSSE